jgi:anti-sigma-K factor RskA
MTSPCTRYREDWDLLALGALEPDVQEEMSVHLRSCGACQDSFCASAAVADAISTVAPESSQLPEYRPVMRPAAAFARVLPWLLTVASLAACLWIGGRERGRPVREIELKPLEPEARQATARAMWSRQGGLLLVARNLPALPGRKCYQLWLIRAKSPAVLSAGLLNIGQDGTGHLFALPGDELDQVTGFAITDEPEGGSVVAKGRKLLAAAY